MSELNNYSKNAFVNSYYTYPSINNKKVSKLVNHSSYLTLVDKCQIKVSFIYIQNEKIELAEAEII